MTLIRLLGFAIVANFAIGEAAAQSIIDLKGTWVGTFQGIMDGPAAHHPVPDAPGSKPAGRFHLGEQPFTFKIEGQDGRRFWGTVGSPHRAERLIGSVSMNGKSIYMVDDDGYLDGTVVDATTLEVCYRQVGTATTGVSCGSIQKK